MLEAYLQGSEGEEVELLVTRTDPEDGTYVAHLPGDDNSWIRIVPDDMRRNEIPMDFVDALVDRCAPAVKTLVCMAHGIDEDRLNREILEEEGEGTPATRTYWEVLDEVIKGAYGA